MPGLTRVESAMHGTPAAGFAPSDIAGLRLWLDGGLSPKSYASGTLVSQWNDLSGNANHAVFPAGREADDGARTINSIPALDFNSATPDYATIAGSLGISTTFHIFMVLILDTNISGGRLMFAGAASITDDGYQFRQVTTNRLALYTCDGVGRNDHQSTNTFTPGSEFVAEAWGDGTTEVGVGVNGSTETEAPTNGCSGPDALGIMAGTTGLTASDGAVAAIYVYDNELGASDRTALLAYLTSRFGVP